MNLKKLQRAYTIVDALNKEELKEVKQILHDLIMEELGLAKK